MSAHRSRRIDRHTAEHLLRGGSVQTQAGGSGALSDLLAAAAAPARESELAGEQAVLAAFRAARLASVPQLRRRSMLIKTALAKLLTLKVAATAVTAVATGGITVAAATGNLPTQHGDSSTAPPMSTVSSTTGPVTPTPSIDPGQTPDTADKNTNGKNAADNNSGDKNAGNSGSPSPSLVGLCQAYTAGAGAEQGKALDNPAFTVLITTAGGKDKVSVYCTDLLGNQPGQSSAAHPTGQPTTHPTGPGQAHPTGKPSDTPPSTRPSH
ncbi:hypothetical protein JOF56_009556 [Kibdelosporangium banguiense]|uniref:Serine/threonine protein kinase n=1 Tax=Kibdelosporangium banguiense TaxID=1365924 RepID=A0ABS4TZ38_9PSEU|nr:hypothetical protein [Kibdelosporangium banguiense]MBP2329171.1 hypothetical protein [Kibdelosporangium banguiense]